MKSPSWLLLHLSAKNEAQMIKYLFYV